MCFCVHDSVATSGCMNMYLDNLRKPLEYQGQSQGHIFFRVFLSAWYPLAVLSLEQGFYLLNLLLKPLLLVCVRWTRLEWLSTLKRTSASLHCGKALLLLYQITSSYCGYLCLSDMIYIILICFFCTTEVDCATEHFSCLFFTLFL